MDTVGFIPIGDITNLVYDFHNGAYVRQVYGADGTLLRRVTSVPGPTIAGAAASLPGGISNPTGMPTVTTTDYRGPVVSESVGSVSVLYPAVTKQTKRVNTPWGFVEDGTVYYHVCDHRGSVRQVINGSTGEVERQYHYYPYGGHFGESTATALTKQGKDAAHRFGGKEMAALAPMRFLDFPAPIRLLAAAILD